MADINEVQVFVDDHHSRCVLALQAIAALADTGSREHREAFGAASSTGWTANGWRVAEKMREIANEAIGNITIAEREDLSIYKRAMESMAAQFVHPKMTALEMAKQQLGIEAPKFKVGDRVRIRFGVDRGHYGTIVSSGGDDGKYYGVKLDCYGMADIGYSEYELDGPQ